MVLLETTLWSLIWQVIELQWAIFIANPWPTIVIFAILFLAFKFLNHMDNEERKKPRQRLFGIFGPFGP